MKLSAMESSVLEDVRNGLSIPEMMGKHCVTRSLVNHSLKRLVDLGALRRVKHGQYDVLITEYETDPEDAARKELARKEREERMARVKPFVIPSLTEEQAFYVIHHMKLMPRSRLAEKLGVPKLWVSYFIDMYQSRKGKKHEKANAGVC